MQLNIPAGNIESSVFGVKLGSKTKVIMADAASDQTILFNYVSFPLTLEKSKC